MTTYLIVSRRGTAAEWAAANPVLAVSERGFEKDTKRWKTGDGVTQWANLPYDKADVLSDTVSRQRVQLTDNCYATGLSGSTVTTAATYRFMHHVGVAGTDIQLGFGNWYTTGTPLIDTDPATSVTFSAAFEDASGQVYQCTFGGQKTVALPGGGFVLSDPLPITVAQGDKVFVRVYQSAGTSYSNRKTVGFLGLPYGGYTATTDLTPTSSAATGTADASGWGPACIIGTPTGAGRPKSVVVQGDSIAYGAADGTYFSGGVGYLDTNAAFSGGGMFFRALSGSAGVLMAGVSGDVLSWYLSGLSHFRRAGLTRFAKFAIIEYGTNDIGGSRTQAQLEADILTQANRNIAKGIIGNILTTLTPRSTSSDSWKTTAGQTTVSTNAIRVAHNAWVRAGCPIVNGVAVAVGTVGALLAGQAGHPILGYVELADPVESARDSGLWKAPNRVVTDAAMSTGAATTLNSATANFTSADIGRDVVVSGAGVAGAALKAQITAILSSTSAAVLVGASTTVSGAQCIIGPVTFDGLHPNTTGNALIATAIKSPLLALLA